MKNKILLLFAIIGIGVSSLFAANEPLNPAEFIPASDTFKISEEKPDAVIIADTMTIVNNQAILEGRVKATRQPDILTCNKAILNNSPQWMHATIKPCFYRKESIVETKVIRETNLTARSIYVGRDDGLLSASDTVVLTIDETTWDLATHTRVIITADDMIAKRDSERLIFSGNVKIFEPSGENPSDGAGNRLDYLHKRNIAILSGNAIIKTWEVDPQTKERTRRILEGKRITYNTQTREAISE